MKLTTKERDIQRYGDGTEREFTIAASPQAFDILSSKIYTDAKLAIVRELSTNAVDSQIEAGNPDKPFDVHLPNAMEPWFSIRDFGTGMSDDAINNVFTTYFQSTRNDSDDYTGALGLGSKSPFSYTDSFSITSYYNGMVSYYSAFKNETGAPSIRLLRQDATIEPNGLEVRIETKPGDEYGFVDSAKRVYQFFKVRPNISGNRVTFDELEVIFEGPDYKIFKEGRYGSLSQLSLVMGNVHYKITNNMLVHTLNYSGKLVMFAPIGACSVAASREELHYDDRTVKYVQAAISEAMTDARQQFEDSFDPDKSTLENIIASLKVRNVLNGIKSSSPIIPGSEVDKYYLKDLRLRGHSQSLRMDGDEYNARLEPQANSTYLFIENDIDGNLKQSNRNKIRRYVQDTRHSRAFLADIEDRSHFVKTFGEPTIKLSELPDPPRKVRTTTGGVPTRSGYVKKFCMGTTLQCDAWLNIDVDDIDLEDAIAVPRKNNHIVFQGEQADYNFITNTARLMGYKKVYGIAEKHFSKICKELGLDSLEEKSKEYAEKTVKGMDELQRSRYHYSEETYMYSLGKFKSAIEGRSDVCDELVAFLTLNSPSRGFKVLLREFNIEVPQASSIIKKFNKRYPLLGSYDIMNNTDSSHIIEYIQLIENK